MGTGCAVRKYHGIIWLVLLHVNGNELEERMGCGALQAEESVL